MSNAKPVPLDDAVAMFVSEHAYRDSSLATIEYYISNIRRFRTDMSVEYVEDWTADKLLTWFVDKKQTCSVHTVRTYHRALKVFSRWLHSRGYLPTDVFANLPTPHKPKDKPEPFSPDDIKLMLLAAKQTRSALRNTAIVLLLLDTGMRVGELTSLQIQDVDFTDRILQVNGKSGPRPVPASIKTMRALRRYIDQTRIATSPTQRTVFLGKEGRSLTTTAVGQAIRNMCLIAGIEGKGLGPHTFRHTFAYSFLAAGGNVFHLQAILGHTTLSMTEQYVKTGRKDLQRTHEQFSPVSNLL